MAVSPSEASTMVQAKARAGSRGSVAPGGGALQSVARKEHAGPGCLGTGSNIC